MRPKCEIQWNGSVKGTKRHNDAAANVRQLELHSFCDNKATDQHRFQMKFINGKQNCEFIGALGQGKEGKDHLDIK